MAGRATKPHVNRQQHHATRVQEADTPKQVLWAYCHWLVAEAFHAGPDHLRVTTEMVRARITELSEARKDPTR